MTKEEVESAFGSGPTPHRTPYATPKPKKQWKPPKHAKSPKQKKRKPQHFNVASLEKFAKTLRTNATESELLMCQLLDSLRIEYEFQPVICGYIPDFLFPNCKKLLELDGKFHKGREAQDNQRDSILKRAGYKILRVPSSRIFTNCDRLIREVQEYLCEPTTARKPPKPVERSKSETDPYREFLFMTHGL